MGRLTRLFLTAIGTVVIVMLAVLQLQTLRVALGASAGTGPWFALAVMFVVFGLVAAYLVAVNRPPPAPMRRRVAQR